MKTIYLALFFLSLFLFENKNGIAQCRPSIKIDGNSLIVDQTHPSAVQLPIWLKAGQTLAIDQNTYSISVVEFTVTGTTLNFSQVLAVTSIQTVPGTAVWKIESVAKQVNPISNTSTTFSKPGILTWKVPSCVNYICIEVWGGGGKGGDNCTSNPYGGGGGGGGGGYGQQCYSGVSGTSLSVTVGSGGSYSSGGGTSSVTGGSVNISASGGTNGSDGSGCGSGSGGTGGSSSATYNLSGQNGGTGTTNCNSGGIYQGTGGSAGNGGSGGIGAATCGTIGVAGTGPGGGGSGGVGGSTIGRAGGDGASGQVKISW